jgi:hypothetical protein
VKIFKILKNDHINFIKISKIKMLKTFLKTVKPTSNFDHLLEYRFQLKSNVKFDPNYNLLVISKNKKIIFEDLYKIESIHGNLINNGNINLKYFGSTRNTNIELIFIENPRSSTIETMNMTLKTDLKITEYKFDRSYVNNKVLDVTFGNLTFT